MSAVQRSEVDTSPNKQRALVSAILQAARFSFVGGAATLTYFVAANLLMITTSLPFGLSSVLGYCCGMAVSFFGHRIYTFRADADASRQFVRFLILSVGGLLISYGSVWFTVDVLKARPFWSTVMTVALVPLMTFIVMKFWIFTPNGDQERKDGDPRGGGAPKP